MEQFAHCCKSNPPGPKFPTVVQQLPSLALSGSAQVRCATLSGRCHTASPRLTLLASNTWRLDLDRVGGEPALLGGPGGVLEWAPAAVSLLSVDISGGRVNQLWHA